MKVKRTYLISILTVFIVIASAAGAFGLGHALADHFGHLGEYSDAQVRARFSDGNTLPENLTNDRWVLQPASTTIRWYHDPNHTSSAYEILFETAINNWTSQISQLLPGPQVFP